VKVELPDLKLPSPHVEEDREIAFQFEESLHAVATKIFPEESERRAMRAALLGAPLVQFHHDKVSFDLKNSLALYRKPGHNEWECDATDRTELFAATGRAVGAALIERQMPRSAPEEPVDPDFAREIAEVDPSRWSESALLWNSDTIEHGWEAVREQLKIKPKVLVPVEVRVAPNATEEALFMRWASEVQSASREKQVRIGTVVVTAAGSDWVRGAILGEPSDRPLPGIRLLGIQLQTGRPHRLAAYRLRLETGGLFGQPSERAP
jgi:hypothetical protein